MGSRVLLCVHIMRIKDIETNKEYKEKIRKSQFCRWCAIGRGENQKGRLAKWGKKVAKKREYSLGKKRNDKKFRLDMARNNRGISSYYDAHFDDGVVVKRRRYKKVEFEKSDIKFVLEEYIKWLESNKNKIVQEVCDDLNKRATWRGARSELSPHVWNENDKETIGISLSFIRYRSKKEYLGDNKET